MKVKNLLSLCLAAVCLMSCELLDLPLFESPQKEEISVSEEIFMATFEQSHDSKTSISSETGEHIDLVWSQGDKISIDDGKNTAIYSTTSDGVSSAEFSLSSGTAVSGALYTAFYPSSLDMSHLMLPSVQKYVYNGIKEYPMRSVSDNRTLQFKNLCGIIQFNLTSNAAREISVSKVILSAPGKGLSGSFTVKDDAAVVQGTSGITLECDSATKLSKTTQTSFNIIVPQGDYDKLSVTIVDSEGNEAEFVSNSTVKVKRSDITRLKMNLGDQSFDSSIEVIHITDSNVDFSNR